MQEIRITCPNGRLMRNDGAIGTTGTMLLEHEDLRVERPAGFAVYATPTWTNRS